MKYILSVILLAVSSVAMAEQKPNTCNTLGPQAPRDITSVLGTNSVVFPWAPAATKLNLCNIHTHTNAEHKGPGYNVLVNKTDNGGYACNETSSLSAAELTNPYGDGAYKNVEPGDTIEVHWVHSSCSVSPGPGLGSCLSSTCESPKLRVEAQVFLVVNDPDAHDFTDFGYGDKSTGVHQAKSLPVSGDTVTYRGSTTGPSYDEMTCSPAQVTWNIAKSCKKVDIASLHRWAASKNVFEETKSHQVRQIVENPAYLAPIKK